MVHSAALALVRRPQAKHAGQHNDVQFCHCGAGGDGSQGAVTAADRLGTSTGL